MEVEPNSPAVDGQRLVQAVGIETLGGVFTPILELGCTLPCESTQVFSTAEDNQAEISIALFRGTAATIAESTALRRYVIRNIRSAPRGDPQIEVTFRADSTGLSLRASDPTSVYLELVRAAE